MKVIKVNNRQSIYDIAVQEYGSPAGIEHIMELNPNIAFSWQSGFSDAVELIIDESLILDQAVVNYYKNKNINIVNLVEVQNIERDFDENDFDENDFN